MEQGISFVALVTLLMTMLFIVESPTMFLIIFLVGGTYLGLRGRNKNWIWKNRN